MICERLARLAGVFLFSAALGACGSSSGLALQQPVQDDARPAFNLHAAFNNTITDTSTLSFEVDGMANGVPYRGSGSYEQGMLQTVSEFDENGGALRKVTPVKMTLDVGGRPVTVESTSQDFYSRYGFRLLGRVGAAPSLEFTEVTSYVGLPAEAQVGASGTLYTAKRYTDTSKRALAGTTTASWSLAPDSAPDTALLVLRVADDRADGAPGIETTTVLRVAQSGVARRVSETTVDAARQTTLKASFL